MDFEDRTTDAGYLVGTCGTCDKPLMYAFYPEFDHQGGEAFDEATLIWPDSGQLHHSVPNSIQSSYTEAFRIREIAPTAFAVQIGRALEFLCEDRKTGGRTLGEKLNSLAKRGEIPGSLAKMTSAIRILRNTGAHATEMAVSVEDAAAIDGFFRSIVEYVYVAQFKLAEYQKRLDEMEKSGKPSASDD